MRLALEMRFEMSAGDRRCADKLTYGYRALGAADRPPGTLAKRHWASVGCCRGSHTRTADRNAIKNTCFPFADESVDEAEVEAANGDLESPRLGCGQAEERLCVLCFSPSIHATAAQCIFIFDITPIRTIYSRQRESERRRGDGASDEHGEIDESIMRKPKLK